MTEKEAKELYKKVCSLRPGDRIVINYKDTKGAEYFYLDMNPSFITAVPLHGNRGIPCLIPVSQVRAVFFPHLRVEIKG